MNLMRYIRTSIFGCASQQPFADLMGVNQSTVARWEAPEYSPDVRQLAQLRRMARERNLPWSDEVIWDMAMEKRSGPVDSVSVTLSGTLD